MKELICRCDKCGGKVTDEYKSLTYKEFINWIAGADCFVSDPLKFHEDIDLCNDCKKQIYDVTRFILELKQYK